MTHRYSTLALRDVTIVSVNLRCVNLRCILDLAGEVAHLNTSFKHFIFFVQEFDLIEKRELAPLQELIENLTGSGVPNSRSGSNLPMHSSFK